MKFIIERFVLAILGIISGALGAVAVAFFPGKELLVIAILFVVAAVLAWRVNESIDTQVQEKYKERFPDNPDVLEEELKKDEPKQE